jgi:hypothetical protein
MRRGRTHRHHGRQRDAPRRIATFHYATLRVAPHRYATREPLGTPGGSRAFSADGHPQAPVAPRRSCAARTFLVAQSWAECITNMPRFNLRQAQPSRLRPTSRFRRLYGLPCSDDFAPGRGGLLQLLGMSLSPCCRFHPAKVSSRVGQISAVHVAFALPLRARPLEILTFEATTRSPLLRPGDS